MTGVGGVIAPTSSHHLLCLFTLSLVPFFGVCRVFKSLTMPLMLSLIFRICTGSIWSTDFKAQAPLHLLLVTIWSVSNHIQRLNKQSGEGGLEADFMINKIWNHVWRNLAAGSDLTKCFGHLRFLFYLVFLSMKNGIWWKEQQHVSDWAFARLLKYHLQRWPCVTSQNVCL